METYRTIYEKLYEHYGPQAWWPAETDLEMMIGAILVQNTSWSNVEKALTKLRPFLDAVTLEKMPIAELAERIRSSGFYNMKAKRVKAFLAWYKQYDYHTEAVKRLDKETLRKALLAIHGIGRETADDMLVYAFDKPVFIVDAYTRRIFYRLGFDMPAAYDDFRREVEAALPNDLAIYNAYHALLVELAKQHCKKTPICTGCPLQTVCAQRIE